MKLTATYTTTAEQLTAFALATGWQEKVMSERTFNEDGSVKKESKEIDNPITDIAHAENLASQTLENMIVKPVEQAIKQASRVSEREAIAVARADVKEELEVTTK